MTNRNSTLATSTKRLKRSWIKRKTRLRNRGGSMFPKRRDKAYTDWIKTLPCLLFALHDCWIPIDPAHVFGTRATGAYDRGEVVPLCRKAHREQEGHTADFMIQWGLNVRRIAKDLLTWYEGEIER